MGDKTAVLQCPICGNRIMGSGTKQLSSNLLDHMTDVHEINPVWQQSGASLSISKNLKTDGEAIVEKTIGENEFHRGPVVRCPICGEELTSEDDESLSSELSHHMFHEHEVVRRLVEWSSSQ